MAATLKSVLGECEGVTLPDDLLPDDTRLIYDDNGIPVVEVELDDEWWAYDSYVDRALAYYNNLHGTDYKVVKGKGRRNICRHTNGTSPLVHCSFIASPTTDSEFEKHFCVEVQPYTLEVVSCRIVHDLEAPGCDYCVFTMPETNQDMVSGSDASGRQEALNRKKSWEDVDPALSEYRRHVADGVTLSDKAKCRLRFPLLALTFFNKKKDMDYKLVDVLPHYTTIVNSHTYMAHGNFIARENGRAGAPNRLFFAELLERKDGWVVTACRVVLGKTTAGCHHCPYEGKRIVHPTHGFRFGLYPYRSGSRRGFHRRAC